MASSRKRPSYPVSPTDSPAALRPRTAVNLPTLVPCTGLVNTGQLKLREQDKLIDVTLKVGDGGGIEIRAHKMLLALCSPYLEGLLAGSFAEAGQDVVELQGVDGAAATVVIDACYTGTIAMTLGTASGVLRAANALQVEAVEAAAVGWVAGQLSVDTVAQWLVFAAQYALLGKHGQALLQQCLEFTAMHFAASVADEAFVTLPAETLALLLGRADLQLGKEEQVLEALRKWWAHDAARRTAALQQLLPCVRLPMLSSDQARLAMFHDDMVAALADASHAGRKLSFELLRECATQFDATNDAQHCPRLWPRECFLSAPQRAALAQAERATSGALKLEGHPQPAFNGVYRRVGQELHEGWPRYACEGSGMQLYRYQASEKWRVSTEYSPHKDSCAGHIGSGGGEVPVGAQPWQTACYDHEWEDRTITVTELVRCPPVVQISIADASACCCHGRPCAVPPSPSFLPASPRTRASFSSPVLALRTGGIGVCVRGGVTAGIARLRSWPPRLLPKSSPSSPFVVPRYRRRYRRHPPRALSLTLPCSFPTCCFSSSLSLFLSADGGGGPAARGGGAAASGGAAAGGGGAGAAARGHWRAGAAGPPETGVQRRVPAGGAGPVRGLAAVRVRVQRCAAAAAPLPGERAVAGERQVQAARGWLHRVHRLGRGRGAGRGAAVEVHGGRPRMGGSHGDGDAAGALPPCC